MLKYNHHHKYCNMALYMTNDIVAAACYVIPATCLRSRYAQVAAWFDDFGYWPWSTMTCRDACSSCILCWRSVQQFGAQHERLSPAEHQVGQLHDMPRLLHCSTPRFMMHCTLHHTTSVTVGKKTTNRSSVPAEGMQVPSGKLKSGAKSGHITALELNSNCWAEPARWACFARWGRQQGEHIKG